MGYNGSGQDTGRIPHRISRRGLLEGAIGASMLAFINACGQSTVATPTSVPSASAATTAAPSVAAKRKPSGTLTATIANIGGRGMTPARLSSVSEAIALTTFSEPLLERKADRSLGPRLAKTWEVSSDGLTYTFNLRSDVKWHDGTPFTSADVKFTMEEVVKQGSVNVRYAQWAASLDHVEAPTPDRVIFKLKKRDVSLIYGLAAPGPATQGMFQKNQIATLGEDAAAANPIGTGPWKFGEYKSGELFRFTAVEDHWRQTPYFQELVIRQVPEEATRLAMLLRGEADLGLLSILSYKQLKDAGLNVFVQPTAYALVIILGGQYLPTRPTFDKTVPWVADPADAKAWERAKKVREAMDVAVDRKTIVDTVLLGQAVPAGYSHATPGSSFDDPAFKAPTYDPARAKQLLAEAGYPNGFDMELLLVESPGRPLAPQVGQAVAQYWQAVGIRVKQANADYAATVRPAIVARKLNKAFTIGIITFDEPVVGYVGNFSSTTDSLYGAEYPPLDKLMEQALAEPDPAKRAAIQLQMGKTAVDNHFIITVAWVNSIIGASKRVKAYPQVAGNTNYPNFEYAAGE